MNQIGAFLDAAELEFDPPFEALAPKAQSAPVVLCSPHSGRAYPEPFVSTSQLDPLTLRRSEDAFVDELFLPAAELGVPLLHAHFPRAYLDANREPYELDPAMFRDALPSYANTRSLRVAGGLGTIARIVSDNHAIYREKLNFAEAKRRIDTLYWPFHGALRGLLERTHEKFGCAVLIDCHSMPSIGGPFDEDPGHTRADIVLGDRYGTACSRTLVDVAERVLRGMGYQVLRNNPYAGGYNTEHYGAPGRGFHALQIEINRALYMDETRLERGAGLDRVARDMRTLVARLSETDFDPLRPAR
jgi:N-formylglutamate amidohydrolase